MIHLFFDNDNLLQATPESPFIVFHAPTPERGVRSDAIIEWMVWHYTACKAPHLSVKHTNMLSTYMAKANYSTTEKERLLKELAGRLLPSALLLCLAGAAEKERESSWDFCVGDGPVEAYGGKLPIVQCNPELTKKYTWHAGQPFNTYNLKSPKKAVKNSEGKIVWDGYKFVYPGGTKVNRVSVGIECELYGMLTKKGDRYFSGELDVTNRLPGGVAEIGGKLYESPHFLADQARAELAILLADTFHLSPERIEQHRAFDPLRRTDVQPPIDITQLREVVENVGAKNL